MASPISVKRIDGAIHKDSYIVILKPDVVKSDFLDYVRGDFGNDKVTHGDWHSKILHGFAGTFSTTQIQTLANHADVHAICEDGMVKKATTVEQTDAPWGLGHICQRPKLNGSDMSYDFHYRYDGSAGQGVDIYVIDSGIYVEHNDFETRATFGFAAQGLPMKDDDGHGTHVAGIAAGMRWGVAKLASLIAVKVLNGVGHGTTTDIISGIDWVYRTAQGSGRPSVANMSFVGPVNHALDMAVSNLKDQGVHVVVAAGNDNNDAMDYSPAHVPNAITVGATNIQDARWIDSNYGSCLTIFAPGHNVKSAGISDPSSTEVMSGTSMACPHVAGLVAYYITLGGNLAPDDMKIKVEKTGTAGILSDIPAGTPNNMAYNGIEG